MMLAFCLTTAVQAQSYCVTPTELTATNITDNSATLSWTGNNDGEEWFLDLYEYNESTGNWITVTWDNYLTSNSVSYDFLAPGTIYRYRVRSQCIDENWSEFSDFHVFTTTEETEPCVISEINIEGFTAPVWGAHPDLEVYVPEGANYTLDEWYWSDYHNHLLPEETFDNENYDYYMFFNVLPNEGCIIAYDATITINNDPELVDDDYSTTVHEFCTFPSIDFHFTETPVEPEEPCEISLIEIEGFTAPAWGAHPDYEVNVPEDANYTLDTYYWVDANDAGDFTESETFNNENTRYFMYFEVTLNDGCSFADNVTVTINEDPSIVYNNPYFFGNTCYLYTIDYTVEKPSCPVPTGLEVSDITSNSAMVSWDPSDAENYDLRYYIALDELENESWQFYDNGNKADHIGTGSYTFYWGVMFPGGTYSTSPTAAVLHVKAYDYMSMTGTVTLYNGGDNAPADSVGSTNVTFTGSNEFVEFTFDEPVVIDPDNNLWVVFYKMIIRIHPQPHTCGG